MTVGEVDAYIANQGAAQQKALNALREVILDCLPDAEQVISYAMPGFRTRGRVIAGMAGYRHFISYYPHSGSVIAQVAGAGQYRGTAGALHFPLDRPIPKRLVRQLIKVKLAMTFKEPADAWIGHGLAAPARRALAGAGILGLKELRGADLADIAKLHGIGPNAVKVLAELKSGPSGGT